MKLHLNIMFTVSMSQSLSINSQIRKFISSPSNLNINWGQCLQWSIMPTWRGVILSLVWNLKLSLIKLAVNPLSRYSIIKPALWILERQIWRIKSQPKSDFFLQFCPWFNFVPNWWYLLLWALCCLRSFPTENHICVPWELAK